MVRAVRSACQGSQASVDKLESLADQAMMDAQVPPVLQASLGCVDLGEIVEKMALLVRLEPTDARVSRDLKERMEIQEEKALVDHVVYLAVAA